jgi:multiple sugar transport system ATP-binding protein
VFLLDEPISHLDAKIRHELRRQFHTLEELRRVATVYVTHDYAEALSLGERIGVMCQGGLGQIGTAREVFQRPQTLFVARHLGQPSINEIPCRLVNHGGRVAAAALTGGLNLPIAPAHLDALSRGNVEEIVLGIRPQHVRVVGDGAAPPDHGAGHVTEARVEIFEALGATGVLQADIAGTPLTGLTSPDQDFAHGQQVRLALAPEDFLYFDRRHGRNLLL